MLPAWGKRPCEDDRENLSDELGRDGYKILIKIRTCIHFISEKVSVRAAFYHIIFLGEEEEQTYCWMLICKWRWANVFVWSKWPLHIWSVSSAQPLSSYCLLSESVTHFNLQVLFLISLTFVFMMKKRVTRGVARSHPALPQWFTSST